MFDLVIEGGTLIDGTGAAARSGDVGIVDGKISALGDFSAAECGQRLDAKGCIVSPGFFDLHTHCLFNSDCNPEGFNMNYLHMGVTTLVSGNCGSSPVDFEKLARDIDNQKDGPNYALLCGHTSIRMKVMGQEDRPPTEDELKQMKRLVDQSMELGCRGFSTGLWYVPAFFAKTEEVIELTKEAAKYGGIYTTHMRGEMGDPEPILEAIRIGRESGLPVQISHHKIMGIDNWGDSEMTLGLIDEARASGVDVMPDQYPYAACSTRLGILIPNWVAAGSEEQIAERFKDPKTRAAIKEEIIYTLKTRFRGELQRILISASIIDPSVVGMTLADIAKKRQADDPLDLAAELIMDLVNGRPAFADTRGVYHTMCEQDVERIMKYPHTSIASDGWGYKLNDGCPHPRNYGTFPRVLSRYCRDRKLMPLEEAIRKMTSLPARRMGFSDRGVLQEGTWADITVFNFEEIQDLATFEQPHQYPLGIDSVIVNGKLALDHGTPTGALPGIYLPRG